MAIVPISHDLLMSLLRPLFPSGVKLVAVRDDSFAGSVEFLLEGEVLPEIVEGAAVPHASTVGGVTATWEAPT